MDEIIEEASKKYQGLVPLVYDIETMGLDEARSEDMQYAVYLKREADKVIAEKDKEITRLDDLAHAHNIELLRKENLIAELQSKLDMLPVWHKVSDCKPPEDTLVLVLVEIQSLRLIELDVYTRKEVRAMQFKTFGDYVTHWMPLPSAPKEGK